MQWNVFIHVTYTQLQSWMTSSDESHWHSVFHLWLCHLPRLSRVEEKISTLFSLIRSKNVNVMLSIESALCPICFRILLELHKGLLLKETWRSTWQMGQIQSLVYSMCICNHGNHQSLCKYGEKPTCCCNDLWGRATFLKSVIHVLSIRKDLGECYLQQGTNDGGTKTLLSDPAWYTRNPSDHLWMWRVALRYWSSRQHRSPIEMLKLREFKQHMRRVSCKKAEWIPLCRHASSPHEETQIQRGRSQIAFTVALSPNLVMLRCCYIRVARLFYAVHLNKSYPIGHLMPNVNNSLMQPPVSMVVRTLDTSNSNVSVTKLYHN